MILVLFFAIQNYNEQHTLANTSFVSEVAGGSCRQLPPAAFGGGQAAVPWHGGFAAAVGTQ